MCIRDRVADEVRQHEHLLGEVPAGLPGSGDQLEDRVERHHLETATAVNSCCGDVGEELLGDAIGAGVAVVVRILEQCPVGPYAPVVDTPGVDGDAADLDPRVLSDLEAPRHGRNECVEVPVKLVDAVTSDGPVSYTHLTLPTIL